MKLMCNERCAQLNLCTMGLGDVCDDYIQLAHIRLWIFPLLLILNTDLLPDTLYSTFYWVRSVSIFFLLI